MNSTKLYQLLLNGAERLSHHGQYIVPDITEKVVALTIDDGPSSRTGEILDILHDCQARATMFLHTDRFSSDTGTAELADRIISEGHEVANHMPEHRLFHNLSPRQFDAEFTRAHDFLTENIATPRLFRPPGGLYNPERMLPTLARLDYHGRFILASYLPWDVHIPLPKQYARHLARGAFPGAIYVLHDGDVPNTDRLDRTIETLKHLMHYLDQKQYRADTLGNLLKRQR